MGDGLKGSTISNECWVGVGGSDEGSDEGDASADAQPAEWRVMRKPYMLPP